MAEIYLRERSTVYQARLKVGGRIIRRTTGSGHPKIAQQEADRLEEQLNKALLQDNDILVSKGLIEMVKFPVRKDNKPFSPNTIRHYTTSAANIIAVLGDFPLRVLDEEMVNTYIKTKLKTGHPVQLRRDLAFLSSLLRHAKRWDCGVTRNPVRDVDTKDIPDAVKRKVYTEYHEFEKVLEACGNQLDSRRFVILAVWTGMRHQEIMKLHWDEIDMKHKLIRLSAERTKNSSPRKIPMHPNVFDTLSDTPDTQRSGFVFKGKKENQAQYSFAKRWGEIRKRAGMPRLRVHDLRHTFASWLKQQEVAESTIMELMGHTTRSMVERYSHDNIKSLRKAVAKMDVDTLADTPPADFFSPAGNVEAIQ